MRRVLQILNNEAEPVFVPKRKPSLIFSCSLTVEDIVSDDEECQRASASYDEDYMTNSASQSVRLNFTARFHVHFISAY
ncbi:hypothetical protein SLA2020_009540 [Shorea laevis]